MIRSGGSPGVLLELRSRVSERARLYLQRSAERGFLGSMPIPEQIDHALGFVCSVEDELGRPPRSFIDLGTGGGLPGIVLCSCWPSSRMLLLDVNERRTEFLVHETESWEDSAPVEVIRGRAEEIGRDKRFREQIEVVTSRSFGPPAVVAECAAPFLSIGGVLVVSEPPEAADDDRWPEAGIAPVGLVAVRRDRFDDRFGYEVLRKSEATPDRFPRRVGRPAKYPLF